MSGGVTFGAISALVGAASATASGAADQVVHWGGVIAILAGFVAAIYSAKLRASLQAQESAADAWKEERDAALAARERIEAQLRECEASRSELSGRTDLTELRAQMSAQHAELIGALADVAKAFRTFAGGGA